MADGNGHGNGHGSAGATAVLDDVQRGLGFAIEMARVFGRAMCHVRLPESDAAAPADAEG